MGTDPVRQHPDEQGLAIGAACNERAQAVVLAHMIAVVVKVLPIFLQAGPPYRVDDGEGAVLAARNQVANTDVVEVNLLIDNRTFRALRCASRHQGLMFGVGISELSQEIPVMLPEGRRRRETGAQNAGNGALRKGNPAEFGVIHFSQESARDELRVID